MVEDNTFAADKNINLANFMRHLDENDHFRTPMSSLTRVEATTLN